MGMVPALPVVIAPEVAAPVVFPVVSVGVIVPDISRRDMRSKRKTMRINKSAVS